MSVFSVLNWTACSLKPEPPVQTSPVQRDWAINWGNHQQILWAFLSFGCSLSKLCELLLIYTFHTIMKSNVSTRARGKIRCFLVMVPIVFSMSCQCQCHSCSDTLKNISLTAYLFDMLSKYFIPLNEMKRNMQLDRTACHSLRFPVVSLKTQWHLVQTN